MTRIVILVFKEARIDFDDHASLTCRHIAPVSGNGILSKKLDTMSSFKIDQRFGAYGFKVASLQKGFMPGKKSHAGR
jgi:hypothetical protein